MQLRGRSIEKFVALNAPGQKDLSREREGERIERYRFRAAFKPEKNLTSFYSLNHHRRNTYIRFFLFFFFFRKSNETSLCKILEQVDFFLLPLFSSVTRARFEKK